MPSCHSLACHGFGPSSQSTEETSLGFFSPQLFQRPIPNPNKLKIDGHDGLTTAALTHQHPILPANGQSPCPPWFSPAHTHKRSLRTPTMPILSSLLSSFIGGKPTDDAASAQQPPQSQPQPPTAPTVPPPSSSSLPPPSPPSRQLQPRTHTPITSDRSLKQLGLFFGGATFVVWSVFLTRRRVRVHQLKAQLPYFYYNHHFAPLGGPSIATTPRSEALLAAEEAARRDPLVAFEALQLATLNVVSAAIMLAGGVGWALDISTLDDLRARARRSIDETADGGLDPDAENEVAEWMAKTLGIDVEAEKEKEKEEEKGKTEGKEEDKKA